MKNIELTTDHRGGAKSTSFSGRPEGKAVRNILKLDELDSGNDVFSVKIPSDTTSFNPSFFLGLFFESVKRCGSIDAFRLKYNIDLSNLRDELKPYIQQDIEDCFRRCNNELNKKTGIDL